MTVRPGIALSTQAVINGSLLVLVAVMPFHAFLSVWLGSIIGHQAQIQSWKEVLIIVLAGLTGWYLACHAEARTKLRTPVVAFIAAYLVVSLLVSAVAEPGLTPFVYGLKTNFEGFLLFVIALSVGNGRITSKAVSLTINLGVVVAIIAVTLSVFLPPTFLSQFGYGPATIEPFRLIGPQEFGIRTPGTLGGPNQLGAFLIIPLCLLAARALKRWRWTYLLASLALLSGIYVSYSRSAWIGTIVGLLIVSLIGLSKRRALLVAGSAAAVMLALVTAVSLTGTDGNLGYYLFHARSGAAVQDDSTAQHALAITDAGATIRSAPLGLGLGSAGPASFQGHNARIPESSYLQIALETGLAGLALFLAIVVSAGLMLRRAAQNEAALGILGALAGLSVVALFLHGWADSTTNIVFWILAGAVCAQPKAEHVNAG